ncbi:SPFH domain-containing protein [Patescibacteria group bacterium]
MDELPDLDKLDDFPEENFEGEPDEDYIPLEPEEKSSSNTTSLLIFTLISALLCLATLYFSLALDNILPVLCVGVACEIIIASGFGSLPVEHWGVMTMHGARTKVFFEEGWYWVPPFIGGCVKIDTREKSQDIPEVTELSANHVLVTVGVSLQKKVSRLGLFLSVEDVDKATNNLTERTVRWFINKNNAIDLPQMKKELSEEIEKELDKIALARWGVDIAEVLVKNIRLPEKLEKILMQKEIEPEERDVEMKNINARNEQVKAMKKGLPGLSDKQALDAVQAEQGKAQRIIVEGDGGDFSKGAAIQRKQGGKS